MNYFDPKHPHEPKISPQFDVDGRCLICLMICKRDNAIRERDEAQKELSSIHRWIERNHPDGFIDSQTYWQNLERVTENWYDRIDAIEADARRFVRERDEAREENTKLRDIAERAIEKVEIENWGIRENSESWKQIRAELDQLKEGAK